MLTLVKIIESTASSSFDEEAVFYIVKDCILKKLNELCYEWYVIQRTSKLEYVENKRKNALRREFSFFPRFVAWDTTRKLLEVLCLGLLSLWSISLPSPLLTLPDLRAERLAELRDARSALAFAELWNFSYSCLTPAAVRLRLPFTVTQNLPNAISPVLEQFAPASFDILVRPSLYSCHWEQLWRCQ